MSIGLDSRCMECSLVRNLAFVRPLGDEAKTTAFAKALMRIMLDAPEGASYPGISPQVNDLLRDMYGIPENRYQQEKIQSNRFVMERLDQIRRKVEFAEDPVYAGLQFAILGNYLDFSALLDNVSFQQMEDMLAKGLEMELERDVYDSLRRDLEQGKKLLYLTDNAGEIGFDRVLGEQIAEKYPQLEITFCVRGQETLNDALRADAEEMGVPFPVIDNGNRIPGTQIDQLSPEAKQALEEADVIIAKGLGNIETMLGCGYNVYYAFLVKCARFEEMFRKPMFTPVLAKERK